MIHRIPSGTRDVLPDETREVHVITEALRGVFDGHGYGEISTPALEYEAVLARADMADARPAYRVFDESGAVLVLRSDMTVPIARVVATRYPTSDPPLRFCYVAHCYRGVRPQRGQPRELLQAGIELIGSPAPQGTAEALTVMCDALDAVGLKGYRVGLGDASLFSALTRLPAPLATGAIAQALSLSAAFAAFALALVTTAAAVSIVAYLGRARRAAAQSVTVGRLGSGHCFGAAIIAEEARLAIAITTRQPGE